MSSFDIPRLTTPLSRRLGMNIRNTRTRIGWTQRQAARAIGISFVSFSRIETGQQLPALPRLDHMARCFKVPLSSLLMIADTDEEFNVAVVEVLARLPPSEKAFALRFLEMYAAHWRDLQTGTAVG